MTWFVDGGQRGGFGDLSGDPIDHPDLLMIQIATLERLPHGGQVVGEPPGAGQQAAHLVGLLTQDHGQLVGHKLTRLGTVGLQHIRCRSGSTLVRDPHIGVSDGRFGEPRHSRRGFPACIRHSLASRAAVVVVIPRHAYMLAVRTDIFRTHERYRREMSPVTSS